MGHPPSSLVHRSLIQHSIQSDHCKMWFRSSVFCLKFLNTFSSYLDEIPNSHTDFHVFSGSSSQLPNCRLFLLSLMIIYPLTHATPASCLFWNLILARHTTDSQPCTDSPHSLLSSQMSIGHSPISFKISSLVTFLVKFRRIISLKSASCYHHHPQFLIQQTLTTLWKLNLTW